ncbi:MAG: class A beta-lactamase-related serine hydrolase [Oscillospiraceae bacterium]|nr:class A beta-lactamase-related serine hydrolase [Oscillospiraceae bacterium]
MKARIIKTLVTILLAVCLAVGVMPCAMAEGTAKDYPDSFFEGRTWDEIMEEFVQQHKVIPGTITAGYKNLVTGEEHYFDPDTLLLSASMYKVPLNMYWSNQVYKGEQDWDFIVKGHKYSDVIKWSIVNSDNEFSMALCDKFGGLRPYREAMLPLVGETADSVDPQFFRNNYYTSRQMIFCLEELFTNSEIYPQVIDLMKIAKPGKYFKEHDHNLEIAHKFGYLFEGHSVANDCAIVYAGEPFAIVVFTCNAYRGYEFLVDFFDMMVAYNAYHARQHKAEAELEEARNARLADLQRGASEAQAELEEAFKDVAETVKGNVSLLMVQGAGETTEAVTTSTEAEDRRAWVGISLALVGAAAAVVMLAVALLRKGKRNPAVIVGCVILLGVSCTLGWSLYRAETGTVTLHSLDPQEIESIFNTESWESSAENTMEDRLFRRMAEQLHVRVAGEPEWEGNQVKLPMICIAADSAGTKELIVQMAQAEIDRCAAEIQAREDILTDQTDYAAKAKEAYAAAFEAYLTHDMEETQTETVLTLVHPNQQWIPVYNEAFLAACAP